MQVDNVTTEQEAAPNKIKAVSILIPLFALISIVLNIINVYTMNELKNQNRSIKLEKASIEYSLDDANKKIEAFGSLNYLKDEVNSLISKVDTAPVSIPSNNTKKNNIQPEHISKITVTTAPVLEIPKASDEKKARIKKELEVLQKKIEGFKEEQVQAKVERDKEIEQNVDDIIRILR